MFKRNKLGLWVISGLDKLVGMRVQSLENKTQLLASDVYGVLLMSEASNKRCFVKSLVAGAIRTGSGRNLEIDGGSAGAREMIERFLSPRQLKP